MTTKQPVSRARAGYQKANEEAAGIVLQDPEKFGGETSLACQWARLVLAKNTPRIEGPLFKRVA